MMRQLIGTLALALAGLASAAMPVEPYGRMPSIEEASLSPDGTKLAFIRTSADIRLISVVSIDSRQVIAAARLGDQKIRDMRWADETHLLITMAVSGMPWGLIGEKHEWHRLLVYDLETHKTRALLDHVGGETQTMNTVYGSPVIRRTDKGTILYLHGIYVSDTTRAALFTVNLKSNEERLIRQGDAGTQFWLIDDNGEVAAEQSYYERNKEWQVRLYRGGHPAESVRGTAAIDAADMIGLSSDGQSIVVAVFEDDAYRWKLLSRKDASWAGRFQANHDVNRSLSLAGSNRLIGAAHDGDAPAYYFDSPEIQANWDWVSRVLHSERVELESMSNDARRMLVRALGPQSGYGYYLADLGEHLVSPVGPVQEGIGPIADVKPMTYAAGDGLPIPAYLTLPPGRDPKHLPLIVMPHGGPQSRDEIGFDYWAQAFAARGYAVLQPNFRGSQLGREWVEKGYGQFGRRMQTDLSDGVKHLAEAGIADPARVCIVGASYGGYAALAGVTLQTGIYRCAASLAGIADPAEMIRHTQRAEAYGQKTGVRYWERFMGVKDANDPALREISPLLHIDQLSVPVLMLHGKEDTVVPFDQSSDMAKALKRAHKAYEFVTLDQEDHHLSRSATRLQALKAVVDFVEKQNPPD
jgi:dipeptidyl aminopeptidase/acylaminoacyl peptidase